MGDVGQLTLGSPREGVSVGRGLGSSVEFVTGAEREW